MKIVDFVLSYTNFILFYLLLTNLFLNQLMINKKNEDGETMDGPDWFHFLRLRVGHNRGSGESRLSRHFTVATF
jgi:hypothetical protein